MRAVSALLVGRFVATGLGRCGARDRAGDRPGGDPMHAAAHGSVPLNTDAPPVVEVLGLQGGRRLPLRFVSARSPEVTTATGAPYEFGLDNMQFTPPVALSSRFGRTNPPQRGLPAPMRFLRTDRGYRVYMEHSRLHRRRDGHGGSHNGSHHSAGAPLTVARATHQAGTCVASAGSTGVLTTSAGPAYGASPSVRGNRVVWTNLIEDRADANSPDRSLLASIV